MGDKTSSTIIALIIIHKSCLFPGFTSSVMFTPVELDPEFLQPYASSKKCFFHT